MGMESRAITFFVDYLDKMCFSCRAERVNIWSTYGHTFCSSVNSWMWVQAGAWCISALLTVWEVLATALMHNVWPAWPL